ncbi:hypothetical protein J2Z32_000511 [Paenibacillus turicensis]|uniref:DUF4085 domain-containing protein n=1 Tax=Paenibacillus turicensis TaxID=160487 RepID=A0ABS4FMT7_9BACL|nr:DUF4085 family protein [Paenibacillus turicensis]MBP1903894.1 hypothetical protein [Paenibacillus turicensis]
MKYLTKEWYMQSQQMGLHTGKKVHKKVGQFSEALFLHLYKEKEKRFIEDQLEFYNYDPRRYLTDTIPVEVWLEGKEKTQNIDEIIAKMSLEERTRFEQQVAEFDARPPFDEIEWKEKFQESLQWNCEHYRVKLPAPILHKIADIRVFALGYCTKEVLKLLSKYSEQSEKNTNDVLEQFRKAQSQEVIPEELHKKFNFHDCLVKELKFETNPVDTNANDANIQTESNPDLILYLDTSGGFTLNNKITFVESKIILQQEQIVNHAWLYSELYCVDGGYEVHVLFEGMSMAELILRCRDIIIEQE